MRAALLALALVACASGGSAGAAGSQQDASAGAGGTLPDGSAGGAGASGAAGAPGGSGGVAGASGNGGSGGTAGGAGSSSGTGGTSGTAGTGGTAGTSGTAGTGGSAGGCPSACQSNVSFQEATSSPPAAGGSGTSKALTDCPTGSTLEDGGSQPTAWCTDHCALSTAVKTLSGAWQCSGDPTAPDGTVCTINFRCLASSWCPDTKTPCP